MTSPVTWLTSSHPIGCFNTGLLFFFVINEEELSKLGGRDSANFEINYHNLALVLPKTNWVYYHKHINKDPPRFSSKKDTCKYLTGATFFVSN